MDFLTGISFNITCNSCRKHFSSGATGKTHPYSDYKCTNCNWEGTLCDTCGTKGCSKCGKKLKSTHERMSDECGGNILF